MGHGYRPVISKIRCENPNKKSTKVKNYNLLHYIATRDGVDLTKIDTLETAINDNIDLNEAGEEIVFGGAENEDYLKYIAHRPRSHGLFGNIDTENFSTISGLMNKISDEKRNIYRGVVSLSELDAQALGYNNVNKWNLYLKSIMPDIASTLGISPNDMTWVAAFHAEQTHPHVHYMLWDNRDIVKSPYIHVSQQNKCREICQNAMFTDENENIIRKITEAERKEYYAAQNESRNEIIGKFKGIFEDSFNIPGVNIEKLPGRMGTDVYKELNQLYKNVLATLPGKGQLKYKFMPPECKAYIDQITDIFLKQPDIRKEYDEYVKAVSNIHKTLGKTKEEIEQSKKDAINELHTRTGNIVMKGIYNIKSDLLQGDGTKIEKELDKDIEKHVPVVPDSVEAVAEVSEAAAPEIEEAVQEEPEPKENNNVSDNLEGKAFWKYIYKITNPKSDKYNPVEAELRLLEKFDEEKPDKYVCKKLGSLYADNNSILENYEKAVFYLEDCIDSTQHDSDIQILLGKIYSDKKYSGFDIQKAEEYYLKALADDSKKYIKLKLSRIYADPNTDICDYNKAVDILTDYNDSKGSVSLQLGNIYNNEQCPFFDKKIALAHYEESALKNNAYAAYFLGKILTNKDSEFYDLEKGINFLHVAADADTLPARILLGRTYLDKESPFYNPEEAQEQLSLALESLENIEKKEFYKLSKTELQSKAQIYKYLGDIQMVHIEPHNYSNALDYYKKCKDTYEALGDTNNVILNSIYIRMAKIHSDKMESFYNPKIAEEYLLTALKNVQKIQAESNTGDNANFMQHIKLQLYKIYKDDISPVRSLDKAMAILKGEYDDKGIFALKRGDIYSNEAYAGYDMQKAISCYKESADMNNTTAMVKIAKCYLYGIGVERDKEKAMDWLNKAADAGDNYAKEYMQKVETGNFNNYSYALLRQIFSSMKQTKDKCKQRLHESEFKSKSKQAKKEEYLHR